MGQQQASMPIWQQKRNIEDTGQGKATRNLAIQSAFVYVYFFRCILVKKIHRNGKDPFIY